jgi:hypothetical protein
MKNAASSEDLMQFASSPFCYAAGPQPDPDFPPPTVQVTARPFLAPSNDQVRQVLDASLQAMRTRYPDLHVISSTSDAIVAGHRAGSIRTQFSVLTKPAEVLVRIPVLSRSFIVFARGFAFSIGLSGSSDERYYDEAEFESILASVRIGA